LTWLINISTNGKKVARTRLKITGEITLDVSERISGYEIAMNKKEIYAAMGGRISMVSIGKS
jgi:hypothetical protein